MYVGNRHSGTGVARFRQRGTVPKDSDVVSAVIGAYAGDEIFRVELVRDDAEKKGKGENYPYHGAGSATPIRTESFRCAPISGTIPWTTNRAKARTMAL